MAEPSEKNPVGRAYLGDVFMRHPLTTQNQEELEILRKARSILERNLSRLKRKPKGGDKEICPVGFSLNDVRYEGFPAGEDTARQRGWRAYLNLGVPLIEEECGIEQPPPDVLSKQTYVNATDPVQFTATDTVEFSISNTISWSLQGTIQLTFGAKTTAAVQAQLQKSMALNKSAKTTVKNSKDNIGVDNESQTQATSTTTASGSATGTGELSAQLMLGITASVSGSLTTAWKHTSSVTFPVGSRVDVMATTRRQIRRFSYDIPVTFGGLVALYYEQPVPVRCTPPQTGNEYCHVIAWPLGEIADGGDNFDMSDPGKRFLQKGVAEVVAVKVGEHRLFQPEEINMADQKQPL
ncbi:MULTISPECIES: gluconolaconase [Streptomyces]|uniref:gluconolaconase n=1 Tax=Streptomyces TaxID=1883 RepID=UPI001CCAF6A9|nr:MULTISPECIES: gluconolaconase [Streptomyces]UBI39032.1 gluconolaconase [Streptomyces mobaraensis]UKW31610.1 gluconolaconase [Streptomyces sp. TYQ1024]